MTNETNAALSALLKIKAINDAADETGKYDVALDEIRDITDAAILEASQRDAQVAEEENPTVDDYHDADFDPDEAEVFSKAVWADHEDEVTMADEAHAHGFFVGWNARRLAARPSVTNVSRGEMLSKLIERFEPDQMGRIVAIPGDLADFMTTTVAAPAPSKAATWREFMDQAPKFNQRQDSMLEQLADLRLVANKLGFYDAADYLKGPLGEPGKAADEGKQEHEDEYGPELFARIVDDANARMV